MAPWLATQILLRYGYNLTFWSVQLYKAGGLSDNASIHAAATFVEYYNQSTFCRFFLKKFYFNLVRIYIDPEIYLMN